MMKCLLVFCFSFLMLLGYSQTSTTIILMRHAEKDTTVVGSTQMQADPPLSTQGLARAEKLVKELAAYPKIDHIFSTDFIRTKSTVAPLAAKTGTPIEIYNHKALEAFADSIRNLRNQTIVIVGHSNTTPKLANLLLKRRIFNHWPNRNIIRFL